MPGVHTEDIAANSEQFVVSIRREQAGPIF